MLRVWMLGVLIALAGPGFADPPRPVPARQLLAAEAVWQAMRLDVLAPILRDEALGEGAEMAEAMFPRGGTGTWLAQVGAIHRPARIRALFLAGMAGAMPAADPRAVRDGLAFYRRPFGQRMLALEASARAAMLDADVEAAARAAFARAAQANDPRAARIARLIEAADLIEPNVAGGLNAAIAFSRGFGEGGGFPMPLSADQILRDARAQEPQLRAETSDWIGAYLFLAYSSLDDAELDGYIAYAGSEAGKALSRLMFAGFDAVFETTAHDMGRAAAAEIRGRKL